MADRPAANPLFIRCQKMQRPVWTLIDQLRYGTLIIPDYQRGRVWTPAQQSAFVGYLFSWAPVPAFFIRQVNAPDGFRDELIDGQQRLCAVMDWAYRKIHADHWQTGEPIWCDSREDARVLLGVSVTTQELPVGATRADALSIYLAINGAGTPHTPEELERVRALLRREVSNG